MLEHEECLKLTHIIAGLYDFTDGGAHNRRVFIQSAGLDRFLLGIDLSGTPRIVAGDLIGRVKKFGYLPERPSYHALGALLSYILTLGELPNDDALCVATVIVKYALVVDSMYINKLCTQYSISDTVINKSKPTSLLPFAPNINTPTFDIAIQPQELEAVINDESNFLDIYLLTGAIYSAQAVCRIEISEGNAYGTGFLIGADLLLTNQHVLTNKDYLEEAVARFDYVIDSRGVTSEGRVFHFQPDFYHSSPVETLDYALVRLKEHPLKDIAIDNNATELSIAELVRKGKHRGYLLLAPRLIKQRDRINIIQHPQGDPMKVVMTNNYVAQDMNESRVQYLADTKPGASGSPVFDHKRWEVVALHHSSQAIPTALKIWDRSPYIVNEGIPIRAILEDFKKRGLDRYLPQK
jgi:V8-like Glu-specific endopeptidase